jgi:hypothetical protein
MDARMRDELGPEVEAWTTHDLRRTWRSLASEARVERAIAESVLGYSPKGIEGTYDRYDPSKERGQALAMVVGRIEVQDFFAPEQVLVISIPLVREAVQ